MWVAGWAEMHVVSNEKNEERETIGQDKSLSKMEHRASMPPIKVLSINFVASFKYLSSSWNIISTLFLKCWVSSADLARMINALIYYLHILLFCFISFWFVPLFSIFIFMCFFHCIFSPFDDQPLEMILSGSSIHYYTYNGRIFISFLRH